MMNRKELKQVIFDHTDFGFWKWNKNKERYEIRYPRITPQKISQLAKLIRKGKVDVQIRNISGKLVIMVKSL